MGQGTYRVWLQRAGCWFVACAGFMDRDNAEHWGRVASEGGLWRVEWVHPGLGEG